MEAAFLMDAMTPPEMLAPSPMQQMADEAAEPKEEMEGTS